VFSPVVVAGLSKRFADENDNVWHMQGAAEFLSRAHQKNKGVIVGDA
jgi:hypothetical protein